MDDEIRKMRIDDCESVVALNRAVEQVTSEMNSERFNHLYAIADLKSVVSDESQVVGFLLAMSEDVAYDNGNFAWFKERYQHFVYVDRIVVDATVRRKGHGRELYLHLFELAARLGKRFICAEVDVEPPNDRSLQFHQQMGFTVCGARDLNPSKRVAMHVREL